MARITVSFNTRAYERTYAHGPRGYGMWAFEIKGHGDHPIMWAPSSTYSAAKKWMVAEVKKLAGSDFSGGVEVMVLT